MIEETVKQMTWHKNGCRYNPEKMVHPSDGEAWSHFDGIRCEKVLEARNVRVALATDGFNLYGMLATPYTCWPVFVIPLNLPLGVVFQRQNIFSSLISPEHLGNKMGVFMELLIDDLVRAWEEGVWTYDRAMKRNLVPLLPARLPGVWDILRRVCSREVLMPSMQDSSEVHLVAEGWQVFFVRQTSTIPPS
jgi:hypothetical protein